MRIRDFTQPLYEVEQHPFLHEVEKLKKQNPALFSAVEVSFRENIEEAKGGIWIDSIVSKSPRGAKQGTEVIGLLVSLADRMGVPLALEAEVEDDEDEEMWRIPYFERFGFYETGNWGGYGSIMFRPPQGSIR